MSNSPLLTSQQPSNRLNRNPVQRSMLTVVGAVCAIWALPSLPLGGSATEDKIHLMASALKARGVGDLESARYYLEELEDLAPGDPSVQHLLRSVVAALGQGQTQYTALESEAPSIPIGSENYAGEDTSIEALVLAESERQRLAADDARASYRAARTLAAADRSQAAIELIDRTLSSTPETSVTAGAISDLRSLRKDLLRKGGISTGSGFSIISATGSVSAEFLAEQSALADMVELGKAQFIAGDYDGAQETFGQVEARDPDNTVAKEYQAQIAEIHLTRGRIDHTKTKTQMLADVSQAWQRPQVFDRDAGPVRDVEEGGLREKLKQIVLPRVNFTGVALSRVIDTLSALSAEYDPAKSGVNIVLIDPEGTDPTVNITLRNLSLDRIMDFIVESVGYEYDLQSDAVVVRQGSGGDTRLETEFFPISRSTIIRLTGIGAGSTSSMASIDPFDPNPPIAASGTSQSEEEEALKSFLQRAGVPFGSVTSANIALADGQLIVTNTRRNLEKVRNILRRYSDIKQVEIEAKFLEVQQGDLEELGINWSITGVNDSFQSSNRSLADAFVINQDTLNTVISAPSGTTTVESGPPVIPNAIDLAEDAGRFGTISGTAGKFGIDAVIRALSRKEGSDLMSAPKVTVLSGKTAEIVVAQELRYPESYGDIQAEVADRGAVSVQGGGVGTVAVTAGTPQDFVVRNIGVEMEVTPTVEDDNSISLLLEPSVTEFEGFVEYGGPSVAIAGATTITVPSGFYQPIFSVRRIRTEVTIWDGATVVMGGLTREQVQTIKDKVPILGDIPILGRLFRSEGKTSQKRNLLIFVTANLISPGGSPQQQQFRTVEPGALFQNPAIVTPGGSVNRGTGDAD